MEMAVVVALDVMATIVAGAPAGCQLGGGSSGGCVGRSSRSGSHRNHQQDFSDFQIPRRLLPLFVGAVAVMVVVVVVSLVMVLLWVVLLLLVNLAKTILLPFALLMTNFVLCILYFNPRLCL